MQLFKEELKKVEAFVFDVDGVFSRHDMNISPSGDLIRTSCTKDGYAMMYCVKKGYPVCIISGGYAPGVRERFNKLGITEVYLGIGDKVLALNEFLGKHHLQPEHVMYMGDKGDIPLRLRRARRLGLCAGCGGSSVEGAGGLDGHGLSCEMHVRHQ